MFFLKLGNQNLSEFVYLIFLRRIDVVVSLYKKQTTSNCAFTGQCVEHKKMSAKGEKKTPPLKFPVKMFLLIYPTEVEYNNQLQQELNFPITNQNPHSPTLRILNLRNTKSDLVSQLALQSSMVVSMQHTIHIVSQ